MDDERPFGTASRYEVHAIGWDISSSAPFSQRARGCLLRSLLCVVLAIGSRFART